MSSIKLTAVEQPSGGVGAISALLLPQPGQHFAKRAARLRQLAQGHEQADYLAFAATVAQAQQRLLERFPVPAEELQALVETERLRGVVGVRRSRSGDEERIRALGLDPTRIPRHIRVAIASGFRGNGLKHQRNAQTQWAFSRTS